MPADPTLRQAVPHGGLRQPFVLERTNLLSSTAAWIAPSSSKAAAASCVNDDKPSVNIAFLEAFLSVIKGNAGLGLDRALQIPSGTQAGKETARQSFARA